MKHHISKLTRLHKNEALKSSRFSRANLTIFGIIFASIGGYYLYASFAAGPSSSTASLFISTAGNDNTCSRLSAPSASVPTVGTQCATAAKAYSLAQPGDTVWVLPGNYTNGSIGFGSGTAPVSKTVNNPNDCNSSAQCIYFMPQPGQETNVVTGSINFRANSAPQHLYYKGFVRGACPNFSPVSFSNSTAGVNDITTDSFKAIDGDTQCRPYIAGPHKYIRIVNSEFSFNCNNGGDAGGMQIQSTQSGMGGEADNHIYVPDHVTMDNNYFHDYIVTNCTGGHQDCIHIYAWTNSVIKNSRFDRCYDSSILAEGLDEAGYPENNIIENNWFGPTVLGVNNCCMRGDSNPANETFDNWIIRFNSSTGSFMNKTGNVLNNVSFIGNIGLGDNVCRTGTNLVWKYNIYNSPGSKCDPTDVSGATNSTVKFVNTSNGNLNLHLQEDSAALNKVPTSLTEGCSAVSEGEDIEGDLRPTAAGQFCDAGADELQSAAVANLWVDTSGGSCTRQATPGPYSDTQACNTFDAAYQAASLGDVVIIKNGNYTDQTLDGPTKSGSGKIILMGESKAGVIVKGIDVKFVNHIAFKDFLLTDPAWNCPSGDPCGNNKMADFHDTADIELDNVDLNRNYKHGGGAGISGNNVGFTWKNSDICCNAEQKLIQIDPYWASPSVTNAVFDNLKVHDQVYLATSYAGEPPHAECWWMIRATNITIKNTKTYDCISTGDMIWGGSANSTGVLIQNTFWGVKYGFQNGVDVVPGSGVGYRGDEGGVLIDGVNTNGTGVIEYSIFQGGIVDDGWASLTLRGNIGAKFQFACKSSTNYTYLYNIWTSAKCSNANGSDNDPISTILDSSNYLNKSAGDWHPVAGAPQINKGDPASYPATDADGNSRPVGVAPDVGLYEFGSSGGTTPPPNPPPTPPGPPTPPPPPPPAGTILLGSQTVQGNADSLQSAQAQVWPFTASASGSAGSLHLYLDSTSTAQGVNVGIYSDSSGNPGTLLTSGTISSPVSGWNSATLSPQISLTSGTSYWIGALGTGSGNLVVRSQSNGPCTTKVNALPNNWTSLKNPFGTTGGNFTSCPVSAYVTQAGSQGPKQGDINSDNSVNITDLSLLLSSYGQNTTTCTTNSSYTCDISTSGASAGKVDIFDLSLLLSGYGS